MFAKNTHLLLRDVESKTIQIEDRSHVYIKTVSTYQYIAHPSVVLLRYQMHILIRNSYFQ